MFDEDRGTNRERGLPQPPFVFSRIRLNQGGGTTDLHRLQPCAARRGARGVQRGEAVERQVQHAQQRAARLREG